MALLVWKALFIFTKSVVCFPVDLLGIVLYFVGDTSWFSLCINSILVGTQKIYQ